MLLCYRVASNCKAKQKTTKLTSNTVRSAHLHLARSLFADKAYRRNSSARCSCLRQADFEEQRSMWTKFADNLARSLFADKAYRRNSSARRSCLRQADFEEQRSMRTKFADNLARSLFADKAQRRKQGEGIVTYVEPLSSSNAVCGQNSQINGGVKVSTGILRYNKRVEPSNLLNCSNFKK